MPTAIIWIILILGCSSAQRLDSEPTDRTPKICKNVFCNRMHKLEEMLRDCVVILGNLRVVLFDHGRKEDFEGITFPKLREVTGYVAFYRVFGLKSIGQLFPNLARIRGQEVLYNYGLIIHDMPHLKEVGLHNLLKIDHGGVIILDVPQACFIHTVNWRTIAPRSRHVLIPVENSPHCNNTCSCSINPSTNYCWNTMKCQRFLNTKDLNCDDQCFGCKRTDSAECTICRNYTYKGRCVSECPVDTIILPHNDYCITNEECNDLGGWLWNNTCVFSCTIGYKKEDTSSGTLCVPCEKCGKTCGSLIIRSIGHMQKAKRCVYINGSLIIRIRYLPDAMEELRNNLWQIQEVSEYIMVYGSLAITSLDFLSSLKRIDGQNLWNDTHSLIVYDMTNIQSLFTENVTSALKIGSGSLYIYSNPMLCMREIERIKHLFPDKPGPFDILQDTNGYSGACANASVSLRLNVINETSVSLHFMHVENPSAHYSILYIHLPQGSRKMFVPETCSDTEWYAHNIPHDLNSNSNVVLTGLRPASMYALCIEKYDPKTNELARSDMLNFTTPAGKPEPPFFLKLVASSPDVVLLRWVDHKTYKTHIKRYELDVTLVDIHSRDVNAESYCDRREDSLKIEEEMDYFRHAIVMRPPPEYDRGCESTCEILSTVTTGAIVEEYFDVCSSIEYGCNGPESEPPKNSSLGKFVRTMSLNLSGPRNDFRVGGLAPFRDYKFRLRACSAEQCSRYARGVVRTLPSKYADIPVITYMDATDKGEIDVMWDPPQVTNGPILSYTVEVYIIEYDVQLHPQTWCQSSEKTHFSVEYNKAKNYLIRVCSTTLASRSACSEGQRLDFIFADSNHSWWWISILFAVFMYLLSLAIGYHKKKRDCCNENLPLDDINASNSDSTCTVQSNLDPIYTIPLPDTQLD